MFNKKKNGKKAFTLVELLVVIAILAILATVSTVGYLGFIENARRSKDIQLVSNINHVLAAEQAYTDSPVAAVEIVEDLEEKGFELKTESKNAYLFYNIYANKVELCELQDDGVLSLTSEDSNNNTGFGKYSSEIYCPESFVNGYLFITKESRDGLAQSISNIRNPKEYSDIEKGVEHINQINSNIGSTFNAFIYDTLFIGRDGNIVSNESTSEEKMFSCVSQYVNNLSKNVINSVISRDVFVLDLPSTLKDVESSVTENDIKSLVEQVVVFASEEFKNNLLQKNIDKMIVSKISEPSKRNDIVKKSTFIQKLDGASIEVTTGLAVLKNEGGLIKIHLGSLIAPSNSDKAFTLKNFSYDSEGLKNISHIQKNGSNSSYYYLEFEDLLDFERYENDIIFVYAHYNDVIPTAEMDGKKYDLKDALLKADYDSNPNTVRYLGSGTNVFELEHGEIMTISKKDTLYIPTSLIDNAPYNNFESLDENNGINNSPSKPNDSYYSSLRINGNLIVKGDLVVGGNINTAMKSTGTSTLNGAWSQVDLGSTGKIYCEGGSNIYAYGKIVSDFSNDASNIENAPVQLFTTQGSNLHVMFSTTGWRGGSKTKDIAYGMVFDDCSLLGDINNCVFPFNGYTFEGIYVKTKISYQSNLRVHFGVFASNQHNLASAVLISSDLDSLFKVKNGGELIYFNYNHNKGKRDNKLYIEMSKGDFEINNLNLSLPGLNLRTGNGTLPVDGRMQLSVINNATVKLSTSNSFGGKKSIRTGLKFLPGSSLTVDNGSTFIVDNSVFVAYEWADTINNPSQGNNSWGYNELFENWSYKKDFFPDNAKITINGIFITEGTSYISSNFYGTGVLDFSTNTNFDIKVQECINSGDVIEVYTIRNHGQKPIINNN